MRVTPLPLVFLLAIATLCYAQQQSPTPPNTQAAAQQQESLSAPAAAKPEPGKPEMPEATRAAQEQRDKAEQARRAALKKELRDNTYFDLRERLRIIDADLSTLQIEKDRTQELVDAWQDVSAARVQELKDRLKDLPRDSEQYRLTLADISDNERWMSEKPKKEPLLRSKLAELEARVHDLQLERDEINAEMTRRIDLEGPQHDFKQAMSITFAVLVAIVIVGFFLIAARDEEVRRDVFSGQAGLQFITLFSLVIAIILFGVIGVLEGKELAALLGGLSGYILGRTTAQREGSDRQAAPVAKLESNVKTPEETLKAA